MCDCMYYRVRNRSRFEKDEMIIKVEDKSKIYILQLFDNTVTDFRVHDLTMNKVFTIEQLIREIEISLDYYIDIVDETYYQEAWDKIKPAEKDLAELVFGHRYLS